MRVGYALEERVDGPGEAALRGEIIDIFPAGASAPYRIKHVDGRIGEIRHYDPLSQRTTDDVGDLSVALGGEPGEPGVPRFAEAPNAGANLPPFCNGAARRRRACPPRGSRPDGGRRASP
ncbi:MAG: hypothetical protein JO095_10880 [Alphaproteobacteria bacterium]|nr:hypothetical protein [Alphaproteobacteria bacterium]MBV9816029.1 hypothetical protein [Alphaproteobacteria bacterium]